MSKTFIGGSVCRQFESEVPAAEEMLDHVVCNNEQHRPTTYFNRRQRVRSYGDPGGSCIPKFVKTS